jgi:outer membrane protein assembly factor BamB
MKQINLLLSFSLFFLVSGSIFSQNDDAISWYSGATDRIYGSPALLGGQLFYGSIDGNIHCVDFASGRKYYHVNLGGSIRSTPLVFDNKLIIVAGNDLLCYDPADMTIKWRFEPQASAEDIAMDEWDYHHSSPILYKGHLYFGSSNGNLYRINPESGDSLSSWKTKELDAIRTTPKIKDGILYFGDWRGIIYALDLETDLYKWTKATRTEQYYENFAGILASIEVGDEILYYGARNQTIKALNKENGETVWSYTSPDGGWISGSPILYGNLLLIAGSDNHKTLCFDALNGELKWTFDFPGNSFSIPIILEDKLIFTTGNAYANLGTNYGRGFIHILNLPDGSLYKEIEFDGNVFSSPVKLGSDLLMGSDNKNMYALDIFELTGIETSLADYLPLHKLKFKCYPNPISGAINVSFEINKNSSVKVEFLDLSGRLIHVEKVEATHAGQVNFESTFNIPNQILIARLFLDNQPQASLKFFAYL